MSVLRNDPARVVSVPDLINQSVTVFDQRLCFLSGQVAWDVNGGIQGSGDHGARARRIAKNIDILLVSVGADRDSIVKETVYVVDWRPGLLPKVFGGPRDGGPTSAGTLVGVESLAVPEALVEVAVVVALDR